MGDLLSLLEAVTNLHHVSSTSRGEYASPCPWCGGEDRFRVWPEHGRYWCRQCSRRGDAIQFLRDFHNLSFKDACKALGRSDFLPAPQRQRECKAIEAVKDAFRRWEKEQLETLTAGYRTKNNAVASWERFIACIHDVSDETNQLWRAWLWQLSDELQGLGTGCDLFTYDRHAKERLRLWDGMQGEGRREAA